MQNFSVLISIYIKTDLSELEQCLNSLFEQSVLSDDIVIVYDGPVKSEVDEYLVALAESHTELNLVKREKNRGLGLALATGMEHCKNELIARMDSDDICAKGRFEAQLREFDEYSDCAVIGGNISEFVGTIDNIQSIREVPSSHEEICEFMKKRCPFNHMTVMFKKAEVLAAGGYQDWYCDEDYYLWARMFLKGAKFHNIDENLVYVRTDNVMERRGGIKYYRSERDLFKFMYKNKMIGRAQYTKAKLTRFILYVLMPDRLRRWAFKRFARSDKK